VGKRTNLIITQGGRNMTRRLQFLRNHLLAT